VKICMIGNSHLAALKLAVENGALDGTGTDMVFFGAPGRRFRKIRFRNGAVRGPKTLHKIFLQVSGGRYTQINPAEFDVVVVYGGAFFLHRLVGGIHHALNNQVHLTEECLATGVERWMTSKHFFRLSDDISKASSATRTILVPRPIPAIAAAAEPEIVDRNMESPWLWNRLEPAFRRRIWNICSQTAERRGVEMFVQPDTTIDANQFTKPEYTSRSTRLLGQGRAHEQADVTHMNPKFGEEVLLHLLAHLGRAAEGTQSVPDASSA